jgi:uncharacterized protein
VKARAHGELLKARALDEPPDRALLVFGAADRPIPEFARRNPYVTNRLVTRWSVRPWNQVIVEKRDLS